jgi:PAS domain S-box-containing protein
VRRRNGGEGLAPDDTNAPPEQDDPLESRTSLALLASIATGVRAGMSAVDVIDLTVERLAAAFPGLRARYCSIDPQGLLTVERSVGPERMTVLDDRRVDLSSTPGYLRILRAGGTVVLDDIVQDPSAAQVPELASSETQAQLDVPVMSPDGLVGVICLDSDEPRRWSACEISALGDVAEYLSIALADTRVVERLREGEAQYRRLVEEIPLVTYVVRRDEWSSTVYVSPQIEQLLGYSVDEWLSDRQLFAKVLHPDDRERVLDELGERRERFCAEYRLIAEDGRVVWVYDEAREEKSPPGGVPTLRGFMLDVTLRKELEDRLYNLQKLEAVGRLAGGVAHQFNNLNAVVSGYAELLEYELGADSPLKTYASAIGDSAKKSAVMIEQLLAFSRRSAQSRARVDLGEAVVSIDALLRGVAADGIEVVIGLCPDPLPVEVDVGQLEEALLRLVENACEAMPTGGTLTISTAREGDDAVLRVSDTGSGMDDETRRRAFEPFFTTKEVGQGTGLGLASVYGTVERSGGRIDVESEPGRGTTIRVSLPLAGQL